LGLLLLLQKFWKKHFQNVLYKFSKQSGKFQTIRNAAELFHLCEHLKKSLNLLPNGEEWNNLKIWKQFRIWKNIYYKSLENNLKMFSLDKITSLQDT